MPVVSNTSPVLNLAIIGQLSLLQEQFGQVWIPSAVVEELRIDESLPGSLSTREAMEAGWLRVEAVRDRPLVQALQRDLDKGEAETIALALQMGAERVLLDEREGRKAAKSLGLKVTGVLGVLLRARREGELSSLREAMEALRGEAGFYIESGLFAELLRESGD